MLGGSWLGHRSGIARKPMSSDHRLPKAETAISAGHFALRKHLEAILLEPPAYVLHEIHVVERSSTQANPVQCSPLAENSGNLDKNAA